MNMGSQNANSIFDGIINTVAIAIAKPKRERVIINFRFIFICFAESEGFEPTGPFRVHTLSRRAP